MANYTSGFFDSVGTDRLYDADDFARYLSGIVSDGCFPNAVGQLNPMQVVQNNVLMGGNPPSVKISAGKAYLKARWIDVPADFVFNLTVSGDTTLQWLIYLMLDTTVAGRAITIEVISASGAAGIALTKPADANGKYYMSLAKVKNITVGGYNPATAQITDMRTPAGLSAVILDGMVTTPKILNDAVTTAKILDDNVTDAKIHSLSASKITGVIDADNLPAAVDKIVSGSATTLTVAPGAWADYTIPLPTGWTTVTGLVASPMEDVAETVSVKNPISSRKVRVINNGGNRTCQFSYIMFGH